MTFEEQSLAHINACFESKTTTRSEIDASSDAAATAAAGDGDFAMNETVSCAMESSEDKECVVCFERVLSKKDPRFGILS